MKVALVGNNDGPLRFYDALTAAGISIPYIGLQKKPLGALAEDYQKLDATLSIGIDEDRMLDDLKAIKVDYILNVFCNFIFRKSFETYSLLNYHLSPLPKYRGRHPMHWALINGENTFGSTIHLMNGKVDDGEIVLQSTVNVPDRCSVQRLRSLLLSNMTARLQELPELLTQQNFRANDSADSTYILRRYPEDSYLTEWDDHKKIHDKIWALSSEQYPAYFMVRDKKYEVLYADVWSKKFVGVTRPTIYAVNANHVFVALSDGRSLKLEVLNHDILPNTKIV